ncbi:MAG: nucleotide sugar dehydrogenase [Bacteroidales bacterium]|nr:nucleotide sugar dehydrogenase [Bacteroidales bacterium]
MNTETITVDNAASVDLNIEQQRIDEFINPERATIVVQGLGFVGTAMAAALSQTRQNDKLLYNVIGIDLADEANYWKIEKVNKGLAPIVSADKSIDVAFEKGKENGNLMATGNHYAYSKADVVVVDINLDVHKNEPGDSYNYEFSYNSYLKAIKDIANNISEETLVIVESTVPPGTTDKVLYPVFQEIFEQRGMDTNKLYLAHSYERVMPGKEYLNSIINFYRVFSGINDESKEKTRKFLESFINTEEFPLTELASTTASEMSKVLENSFRAANIAFMQEWTEFAERAGVDMFEVIKAIRIRPTHRNIMAPGFGVGGYCLTKDALLADWANMNLFNSPNHLDVSLNAIKINDLMPGHTFDILKEEYPDMRDLNIIIMGVSYLNDVADTRYSPTEFFYDKCWDAGAKLTVHDPIVTYWHEKNMAVNNSLEQVMSKKFKVAIFAVRHTEYIDLSATNIMETLPDVRFIIDANNVLSNSICETLCENDIRVVGVGKGHLFSSI